MLTATSIIPPNPSFGESERRLCRFGQYGALCWLFFCDDPQICPFREITAAAATGCRGSRDRLFVVQMGGNISVSPMSGTVSSLGSRVCYWYTRKTIAPYTVGTVAKLTGVEVPFRAELVDELDATMPYLTPALAVG